MKEDESPLPSWDHDMTVPLYLMLSGGTSVVSLSGTDENGDKLERDLIALHVVGRNFVNGEEIDPGTPAEIVITMSMESAVQTWRNLGQTIKDFHEGHQDKENGK